jgi:CHRD domain
MNAQVLRVGLAVAAAGAVAVTTVVAAQGDPGHDHGSRTVRAFLTGYDEDPLAFSTPGSGFFKATIDPKAHEIRYELTYSGLPTEVQQAHVHLGKSSQSGGISAFLCTNLGNGPAGTPACPAGGGTVTGTITPATVVGPSAQGISAGEFGELVDAINARTVYANVHTSERPGGEIRGQLR